MAKALSKWLCNKSTKNMFVKIVHPGGHRELHDRPILASEIILRNPKCVVAYPHVFQQPWAVVSPDTVLLQGQKFYVVPVSTIKKLQRHHLRRSPSPLRHQINMEHANNTNNNNELKEEKCSCFSNNKENCFAYMFNGSKVDKASKGDGVFRHDEGTSKGVAKEKNEVLLPSRSPAPFYNWQPALQSVCEEI